MRKNTFTNVGSYTLEQKTQLLRNYIACSGDMQRVWRNVGKVRHTCVGWDGFLPLTSVYCGYVYIGDVAVCSYCGRAYYRV